MNFKLFFKNIKYLFRVNLKDMAKTVNDDSRYDELKYELYDDIENLKLPKIKNIEQTINDLINTNASICRFGDGELKLLEGNDIPYQKASKKLSNRLVEIISSKDTNIFIAIPRIIYSSKNNTVILSRKFWTENGRNFRNRLEKYIDFNTQYYSAEVTLAFSIFEKYDIKNYFDEIAKIWKNKDITIICGETVFNKIEHNIFDNAKSIEYQYAPSVNAFDDYENILNRSLQINKERIIISILGPTAKVLSYDLAKQGYRALDLGHIAKSYDWWCKGLNTNGIDAANDFFDVI